MAARIIDAPPRVLRPDTESALQRQALVLASGQSVLVTEVDWDFSVGRNNPLELRRESRRKRENGRHGAGLSATYP
jgi:hypothetical protein